METKRKKENQTIINLMEYEGLADVAPGRAWCPKHDEHKQHDTDAKAGAGVHRVYNKRHYYWRHKANLTESVFSHQKLEVHQ